MSQTRTPSRSATTQSTSKTPTSSTNATANAVQHRLVYRGALSLPDSYVLLDGLSFVAETRVDGVPGSPAVNDLLDNPLALTLESMRGRPSLHLLGTERLQDVWLDSKAAVTVWIHPYSVISQIYFHNMLCLDTITDKDSRTNIGIRVSVSDNSDPSDSDILIYGQLIPASADTSSLEHSHKLPSSSSSEPYVLQMYAARILPGPPPPAVRPPRPDDPTPRKPPAHLLEYAGGSKRKREASSANLTAAGKRAKAGVLQDDENVRRAREVMLYGPGAQPKKLSRAKTVGDDVFKVPEVPLRAATLEDISSQSMSQDVFGDVSSVSKGKGKEVEKPGSSELEKANKMLIKQAAAACLAKHGVEKGDTDFVDIFQATYRGTCFAIRNLIRTQAVNMRIVERLLESHSRMYVKGTGESHVISGETTKP